jgi:hypothetical protein
MADLRATQLWDRLEDIYTLQRSSDSDYELARLAAKDFSSHPRTIERWLSGETPVPKWVPDRIESLKRERGL